MPEPTATVMFSRFGPLMGERNSSAGLVLPSSKYACMSFSRPGTSSGSVHALVANGPLGDHHRGLDLAAAGRVEERDELLRGLELVALGGLRDVDRVRQPHRQLGVRGVLRRAAGTRRCRRVVGVVLLDGRDDAGEHRVVRALAGARSMRAPSSYSADAKSSFDQPASNRPPLVARSPGARARRRTCARWRCTPRPSRGPARARCRSRRARTAGSSTCRRTSGSTRVVARGLDRLVVGGELVPRRRDLEAERLVDLLVVEHGAGLRGAERGAVDAVVGGDDRLKSSCR